MTVVELKEKLIEKISNTDDKKMLERITWVIDIDPETENIYEMSAEEKAAVQEGLDDLDNGKRITNEESNKRADEWLK
jgi:predicted transcriptional regulator